MSEGIIQLLAQFGFPAIVSFALLMILERKLNGIADVPRQLDVIAKELKELTVAQRESSVLLQQACQQLTLRATPRTRAAK